MASTKKSSFEIVRTKVCHYIRNLPSSLGYEITHNTTIINVHSRAIGIENPSNPYLCYRIGRCGVNIV